MSKSKTPANIDQSLSDLLHPVTPDISIGLSPTGNLQYIISFRKSQNIAAYLRMLQYVEDKGYNYIGHKWSMELVVTTALEIDELKELAEHSVAFQRASGEDSGIFR